MGTVATASEADRLAALLDAWRADVDRDPIQPLVDVDLALALLTRTPDGSASPVHDRRVRSVSR